MIVQWWHWVDWCIAMVMSGPGVDRSVIGIACIADDIYRGSS